MQEKITPKCTFLHRTDILAAAKGINVQELTELLGLSRRTLFMCRANDSHVSKKTLMRLEAAEKAAGIAQEEPAEKHLTRELLPPMPSNLVTRDEFAEMGAKLDRLTDLVEMLIEQRATSSSGRGQAVGSKKKNSA